MKIYAAGTSMILRREIALVKAGSRNRLFSYHYHKQGDTAHKEFKYWVEMKKDLLAREKDNGKV